MLPCYRVVNLFLPRSCLSKACIGALPTRALSDFSGSFQEHCSPLKVSCCRQLNCFVEALHDDLTPRFRLRHTSSRQQGFGGTLARKTQLAQSIQHCAERFVRSSILIEQVMQSFELMNRRCRQDADLNIARQSVNYLSLHVLHVGFIRHLLNSKRLVIQVKGSEASYC